MATLKTAAKTALGLSTNNFAASGSTGVTFTVTGFAAGSGYALTSSASDLSAATPQFTASTGASAAITAIDAAINNLNTTIENTTASESRIRDTDKASEMTNFTRTQVLTQAGTTRRSTNW